MADHDALTGLVNRRGFGRELRRHVSRLQRYGAKGALLMIDLDNFKAYNDAHGHGGGDALLQAVANSLGARLRAGDVLGRIGGDEFSVLLPEVTAEEAEVVAGALVQAVRELDENGSPKVTASVGIFCFDEQDQALSGAPCDGRRRSGHVRRQARRPRPLRAARTMDIRARITDDVRALVQTEGTARAEERKRPNGH